MEPPRAAPRVAEPASLTRLWRKADGDIADHVVSFLPTKCLAVLPTLADSFRRDQWRMLGVVMRRQNAAAGTRAILSTLQVLGREVSHYREDWSDQADLIPQRWRGCKGGRGAPADVDLEHKVGISSNTTNPGLIIDRTTPHNSVFIGVVNPGLGVEDRCCMQRFRVSLRYNGNREGTGGSGLCGNQPVCRVPPRHRACVASMARRATRRFSTRTRRKILISTQVPGAISESSPRGSARWRAMQQTSGYILAITLFLCMWIVSRRASI